MSEGITRQRLPRGIDVIASVFVLKNDCSSRLLMDPRLDEAWPWLRKLSAHQKHFDTGLPNYFRSYGRLSGEQLGRLPFGDPLGHLSLPPQLRANLLNINGGCSPLEYDLDIEELTVFDHLAAAMYCDLVSEFDQSPPYGTQSSVNTWAKQCFDAADLCEMHRGSDVTIWHKAELQAALVTVRDYLRDKGEERLMKNNPRIVERSSGKRGDDKLRGTARKITTLVQDYFGPFPGDFPHAAAARFLLVGWGLDVNPKAFTKKVSEWCEDLVEPNFSNSKALPE